MVTANQSWRADLPSSTRQRAGMDRLFCSEVVAFGRRGLAPQHGIAVRMAAEASRLPEYPRDPGDGRQHVEALTARFASLAKTTRAAIDAAADFEDVDTSDLFTEVSRGLDKHLWFLESHLTS